MLKHFLRSALSSYRFAGILAAVVLLSTAGCSNDITEPPPHLASDGSSESGRDAFTFGIIYPVAHPYYENITELAEQAASAAGGRLIVRAPDEANVEGQIRVLENMIRLQPDGIAISPIDSDALTPYINQAIDAGIPVVCFESDAPASRRLAYIGGDNERAGAQMGQALDELLHKGGMVLVESGIASMSSHQERLDGFLDYVREETGIQILEIKTHEGSSTHALAELEQMIDDHPHFDAFVALDFISGSSSIVAWKAMGLNRYALTFGMMPAIEEAIVNGQITLAVTQNETFWAGEIVKVLLRAMAGEPLAVTYDTGDSTIDLADIKGDAQ